MISPVIILPVILNATVACCHVTIKKINDHVFFYFKSKHNFFCIFQKIWLILWILLLLTIKWSRSMSSLARTIEPQKIMYNPNLVNFIFQSIVMKRLILFFSNLWIFFIFWDLNYIKFIWYFQNIFLYHTNIERITIYSIFLITLLIHRIFKIVLL